MSSLPRASAQNFVIENTGNTALDNRVQRFGEALAAVREAKAKRDGLAESLESYSKRIGLAMARGEHGGFKSTASDKTGRKAELDAFLHSDEEYQGRSRQLASAQEALDAANDLVSQLKYFQKERHIQSVYDLKDGLDAADRMVRAFAKAVDIYVDAKSGRPPARTRSVA